MGIEKLLQQGESDVERFRRIVEAMPSNGPWNKGNEPPLSEPGIWSKPVVALTNLGGVHFLSYMRGGDGRAGCWQRPSSFDDSECVEWWAAPPDGFPY